MLNYVEVYFREIICEAIKINVSVLIFVYNYFSGCVEFSKVDKFIIEWIIKSCQFMDLCVFDYIVIGCGKYVFFVECGWI